MCLLTGYSKEQRNFFKYLTALKIDDQYGIFTLFLQLSFLMNTFSFLMI